MNRKLNRRRFLQGSAALGSVLFLPKLSWARSANGRLQHACIGVGGMGLSDLQSILAGGTTDIVALCDVDLSNLTKAAAWLKTEHQIESVRLYRDWRELLEREGDRIDSVNVSTPDHMHAPIAFTALKLGDPLSVMTEVSNTNTETFPAWQIVHYEFPATEYTAGKTVQGTWYNGEKTPPASSYPCPPNTSCPRPKGISINPTVRAGPSPT
jgi:hypothetical protein